MMTKLKNTTTEDQSGLLLGHQLTKEIWRSEDASVENTTFQDLQLPEKIIKGLEKNGFRHPSKIQLKAIPLGRIGLDLVVQSKAGTGKTCVFGVIALEAVNVESKGTQVLVLAPTREIATQVTEVIASIGKEMSGLSVKTFIGGTKVKNDKDGLKKCHIAVATPGRVKQLIECGLLKTNSIRLLVLDEADKLMDDNFKEQINDIFKTLPDSKQMIVTSATYPKELSEFLSRYMRTPSFVRLDIEKPALLGITQYYHLTPYSSTNHVAFDYKIKPLENILKRISFSQCIIFSNFHSRARDLCKMLKSKGWPSEFICGDQEQKERFEIISKMKNLNCRVLVSTDLISRGVDCANINLVINLDVPQNAETYLHRIGRAGRFGQKGMSITLVTRGTEEQLFKDIQKQYPMDVYMLPDLSTVSDIWNVHTEPEDNHLFDSGKFLEEVKTRNGSKDCEKKNGSAMYERRYLTFSQAKADFLDYSKCSLGHNGSSRLKLKAGNLIKRVLLSDFEIASRIKLIPCSVEMGLENEYSVKAT